MSSTVVSVPITPPVWSWIGVLTGTTILPLTFERTGSETASWPATALLK